MKIITITLNPVYDVHIEAKEFKPYLETYADSVLVSIGGKGINVSRALSSRGVPNTAYIVLGKENSKDFEKMLAQYGIVYKAFYVEGVIRNNISVHTEGFSDTRICFKGLTVSDRIMGRIRESLIGETDGNTVVVFSGKLPCGMTQAYASEFLKGIVDETGCRLCIDSNSFSAKDLSLIKPWLVKPNQYEIAGLTGIKGDCAERAISAAEELYRAGIANVIVSMGSGGAVAVCGGDKYRVSVPGIKAVSEVGAGDNMVAGFLEADAQGLSPDKCLAYAATCATASCLTEGTKPPDSDHIEMLAQRILVERIFS